MIRTDFVSNSSSASFVISKEKHGCCYSQAFEILNKLDKRWYQKIGIVFEPDIDYTIFLEFLNLKPEFRVTDDNYTTYFNISASTKYYFEDKYYDKIISVCTNIVDVVNKIPKEYINKIIALHVDLHDECDIGAYSTEYVYNMLKETGLNFEFNR